MEMIVCVKQIPDPEAPPASFRIEATARKVTTSPEVQPVVSPFDEIAVEAALRLKDIHGGQITVLSLGNNLTRSVVKKPLAMGADKLILLEDQLFEDGDAWSTAYALASAVKKTGHYDIIFCGRQAADWDAGQVGLGLAVLLGIPAVNLAKKVEMKNGKLRIERMVANGFEILEAPLPCLITITNELGEPRYAGMKGILKAAKITPVIWKPQDLGLDPAKIGVQGRRTRLAKLFQPVKEGKCEIIEGENAAEAAANLALRLREVKII